MNTQTIKQLACAVCTFACMLINPATNLRAQSVFGSIRGTTQDETGGAVAQVAVTLHNADENTDLATLSDSSGNYLFQNLKPGHYRFTAEKDGFAKSITDKVELAARQDIRLDLKLAVSGTKQEIQVVGEAAAVNTENATLTDSKINSDITGLPINSRAVSSSPLAALAVSPSVTKDSQGNFAVGGATASQVGFSVDGVSTANVRQNGALQDAYPSMEGIAEMKVTAFNNNAEFAQIGDVTFVTKSGTNQLHGSAYEYFQNKALDATVLNFGTKAPKSFNTFGGSLGGPVTIPKLYHGKDKTFFFIDYEGNRKTQSYPEQLLVPTVAERNGNLSDLVAASGLPVINPFTGASFPNNTIPTGSCQACINPVAQSLLNNYYPLPNANIGAINPSYNYQTLVPIPSNSNGFDARLDHNITSNQQIYARFSLKNVDYTLSNNAGVISPANNFLPPDRAREQNRSLVVSYNYSITPKLLNEFRFGFTNFNENDSFPIQGATAISQLGLVIDDGVNLASHPTASTFPTFNFADGTITSIGQDRVGKTISGTVQLTDNLTRIQGRHTFRFGLDIRRQRYNALMYFVPSDDYGNFTFSGNLTNYSYGDFLLGLPNPSFFAAIGPQMDAHTFHWGVYGQDTWQVNSHLTVNYGLRWELLPPFVETNGDIATILPTSKSVTVVVPDKFYHFIANNSVYQQLYTGFLQGFNACALPGKTSSLPCSNIETASKAGLPQGLRYWNWRDFDPRVSLAYRPFNNNNTVIRAGFGIYTMSTLGPTSFNSGIIALSDLVTYNNYFTNGVPQFQFPRTSPIGAAAVIGGGNFEEGNNPHWKDPTSAQWNLTVEREVTPNMTVRFSYTGQESYHLPITVDLNQIPASTTPLHCSEQRILSRRSPCALPELEHIDEFREYRDSKLSGGYCRVHTQGVARAGVPGELHSREKYQRRAEQRRALRLCGRRAVCRDHCRPLQHQVRSRQRGGNAAAARLIHRHIRAAVRKRAGLAGTSFLEPCDRRLDSQHGDDDTNRPVAHAHDAGDLRSIEYQYDRENNRRGHCAAGLYWKPIRKPDVSAVLQRQCLRFAVSQRRPVRELRPRYPAGASHDRCGHGPRQALQPWRAVPHPLRSYVH
jgi:hypothetical protein